MSLDLKGLAKQLFDLNLSEGQVSLFDAYAEQIIEWNQRINLTSITQPDEIKIKHFLDSLSLLTLPNLPLQVKVIDIGTGAGLPGMALKIAKPKWQIMLNDATGKKIIFLNAVITELKLEGIRAEQARAEEMGQHAAHRQQYDLVVARAVARLPTLVEYLLPLCKIGGLCVAMKGDTAQVEAQDAAFAVQTLGGQLEKIQEIRLPNVEDSHYLVCVRKIKGTPQEYPRRDGSPAKRPLQG